MKNAERCCVCGYAFTTYNDPIFGREKVRQMLNRNGKHICKPCYQKILAVIAIRGDARNDK